MADRVTYELGVTVYKCLYGQAPDYLPELCTPVAQAAERQHLRSASRHLLVVPRFQLDTYGRRTFAVAGPTTRNLFQNICVSRTWHANWLFSSYTEDVSFLSVLGTLSALEAFFATMHYINWHLHLHSAFLCQYLLGLPGFHLKFSGIYSSACFAILVWSMHRIHPSHFKHLHCVTVSICCSPLHFLTLHLLPGLSTDSLNSSLPFVMCSLQSL